MANDLSAFNSEAWSQLLVTKIDWVNIMLPLVNRKWEGDLRQNKTVWVRTPGSITTGPYSRGTIIAYQNLTPVKEAFTVNDGVYFAFDVDDIDKAQSDINAMDVYMKRAVVTLNQDVELKLLATYSSAGVTLGAEPAGTGASLTPVVSGGQVTAVTINAGGTGYTTAPALFFVGGNGNGATATATVAGGAITAVTITNPGNNYTIAPRVKLTTAANVALTSGAAGPANTDVYHVINSVRAVLSNQNLSTINNERWGIVDPDTTALLLEDTNHFIRAGALGDQVVQTAIIGGEAVERTAANAPGFIGRMLGFNMYETPHTPRSGSSKFLLFGDNEAISYAAQITEIEALRRQDTFANAVRGLMLHDTFVPAESSKRLVAVQCAA